MSGFFDWLDARGDRREARRLLLIERGLDFRSMALRTFEALDPKFFVALAIIGLFAWAFAENAGNETFIGALIAGFAGAWGYYLGSSNTASRANDRADNALALGTEALRQLPAREPDVTLKPGETAQAEPLADEEPNART